jgi:pyruvate/2-oxoglutarate dehydrogenase complex dihydrolipoamide acyltransferase (E2) component
VVAEGKKTKRKGAFSRRSAVAFQCRPRHTRPRCTRPGASRGSRAARRGWPTRRQTEARGERQGFRRFPLTRCVDRAQRKYLNIADARARLFSCALSSAPTLSFRASTTKRSSLTAHTLLNADANANANADANARLLFSRTYVEQPITTTASYQVTAANGETTSRETSAPPDLARVWPSVRRLLAESKLDGSNIAPTGPKRTLTKGDVLAAMGLCAPPKAQQSSFSFSPTETASSESSSAVSSSTKTLDTNANVSEEEPSFEDLPVTPTRRVIASRLLASKAGAPHFYVSSDVSLFGVEKLRVDLKQRGVKASVNDCVMYAVSRALRLYPESKRRG